MKRYVAIIAAVLCLSASLKAQERLQNKPYIDLRQFHFGVVVGTHFQDLELLNGGPQIITSDDGTQVEAVVVADQDRWDSGFNVGVLGELRLSKHFQFRVAPAMYFGTRHITLRDLTVLDANGNPTEQTQEMKSAYISFAADLIFAAPRRGNRRPYIMAGLNPMLNLSGKNTDYLKLKSSDVFVEVGLGCDFYLPFFKLRPELKFLYSLTSSLDTSHADDLRDANMLRYTNSVTEAHSKMIVLSFYFE